MLLMQLALISKIFLTLFWFFPLLFLSKIPKKLLILNGFGFD